MPVTRLVSTLSLSVHTQTTRCASLAILFFAIVSVALADYEPLRLPELQSDTPQSLRLTADLALVRAAAGVQWYPWDSNVDFRLPGPYLRTRFLNVGVGLEKPHGPGVAVSTTLLDYDEEAGDGSILPVSVRLSWDLSSDPRWHHSSVYAFATLHHTDYENGHILDGPPEFAQTELGVGVAYTYYALTPTAEFRVSPEVRQGVGTRLVLAFGLDLGGTYGFGQSPIDEY